MGVVYNDPQHQPVERHPAGKVVIADATGAPSDKSRPSPGSGSAGVKPADAEPAALFEGEGYLESVSEIEAGLAPIGDPKYSNKHLVDGVRFYVIGKFGKDAIANYDKAKEATDELVTFSFQKGKDGKYLDAKYEVPENRDALVGTVNNYLQSCLISAIINAKKAGDQVALDKAKNKAMTYVTDKSDSNYMSDRNRLKSLIFMMSLALKDSRFDKKFVKELYDVFDNVALKCGQIMSPKPSNHP
jgi:hypothetical protein